MRPRPRVTSSAPARATQPSRCAREGAVGSWVGASRLGGDADAGELLRLLEQGQGPTGVDAARHRDGHVGRAVEAGGRGRCALGAAQHRLAPEPVERQAERRGDAGHEVAATVAGVDEHRALHRDDGVEGVVDEGRPEAVEDATAQRMLGHRPGVDGGGGPGEVGPWTSWS